MQVMLEQDFYEGSLSPLFLQINKYIKMAYSLYDKVVCFFFIIYFMNMYTTVCNIVKTDVYNAFINLICPYCLVLLTIQINSSPQIPTFKKVPHFSHVFQESQNEIKACDGLSLTIQLFALQILSSKVFTTN
jgi:hypothetical protein